MTKLIQWIVDFVIGNWKVILPIILVGLVYWYHTNAVNNAYEAGIEAEKQANAKRVAEQNKRNREFEEMMRGIIRDFNQNLINEAAERTAKTVKLTSGVEQIMVDKPIYQQCLVDPEVLNLRNQIRALGPEVNNEE